MISVLKKLNKKNKNLTVGLLLLLLLAPNVTFAIFGIEKLPSFIFSAFVFIGSWILAGGGALLNYSVVQGVLHFSNFGATSAVSTIWGVMRDMSNVAFIFIFLFIGIATILGIEKYGFYKALPKLLIAAVLMNFSLFATQAIIDSSHLLSAAFINGAGIELGKNPLDVQKGFAAPFVDQMRLTSFFDPNQDQILTLVSDNPGKTAMVGVMMFAFMVVGAFAFIAIAFALISRIVKLLVLMASSSLAVMAWATPWTKKFWDDWLKTFMTQVFYAPIIIFMLIIVLKFLQAIPTGNMTFATALIGYGENTNDIYDFAGIFFNFFLAVGLLFFVMNTSKALSETGTAMGFKAINNVTRSVQNRVTRTAGFATAGLVARTGQGTIGAGASAAKSFILKNKGLRESYAGRMLVGGLGTVANQSYDPRGLMKGALKEAGVDAGKPVDKREDRLKKREKATVDYAESMKRSKTEEEELKVAKETLELLERQEKDETKQLNKEKEEERAINRDLVAAEAKAKLARERGDAKEETEQIEQAKIYAAKLKKQKEEVEKKEKSLENKKEEVAAAKKKKQEAEKNPQLDYAKKVEEDVVTRLAPFTVTGASNKSAMEKIRKNATKSKEDQDKDRLWKTLGDLGKKKDDGGDKKDEAKK